MANRERLIVVTGPDRPIMRWLSTLRSKGEYDGDVLIIDYDLSEHVKVELRKDLKVILSKRYERTKNISGDRFKAFYDYLKDIWMNYDTIMIIDGSDVEFYSSIQPLFDMASREVCYVTEDKPNKAWVRYTGTPDADKVWEVIKYKLIINSGMYVGPSNMIFQIVKYIVGNLEYGSYWGIDQLSFNAMIYYYGIPSREVDKRWNYDARGKKIDDKLLMEISILHRI